MPIRPATINDLPGILEIYNEAVLKTTATYDSVPQTLEQRRAWFDRLQQGSYPVIVAVDHQDQVIAWGALNPYHTKPGYRFTTENSVYVRPTHQRRGLGRQLLQTLIEAGKRGGFHSIIAAIDAGSAASVALHAALGFEEVGHFKEVGHKFGGWLDVIYMQLRLA